MSKSLLVHFSLRKPLVESCRDKNSEAVRELPLFISIHDVMRHKSSGFMMLSFKHLTCEFTFIYFFWIISRKASKQKGESLAGIAVFHSRHDEFNQSFHFFL